MKLYRACNSDDANKSEIWFASDPEYLSRVEQRRSIAKVIEFDLDISGNHSLFRRHGKKNMPNGFKNISAFHSGDTDCIQVKFEHGSLNFGFYGKAISLIPNI